MSASRASRPRVPLRRNRNFMLLWSGQTVSELGSRTSQIAYPLLVLALTGSPAKAGIVGFAAGLPHIAFSLPAGALVDRWDRKLVMLVCDGGRAIAVASIATALALGELTFVHVALVAFVEGTLTVSVGPAEFGALRTIVPAEQIPAAIAQNEARVYSATLAGPPLGGFLFGVDRALPFVVDAISYAVAFVTLVLSKADFQEPRTAAITTLRSDIAEGVCWLWRQTFLRSTALLSGAGNFVSNGLGLIVIVLARERGASPATIGSLFALFAAGGLVGAAAAPLLQRRIPAPKAIIGYLGVYSLLIPLFAFVPPVVIGLLFAAMLFGAPALNAIYGAYQAALIPDRLVGRVKSANALVTAGSGPIGVLFAGFLLEAVGSRATVGVFAGLSATSALAALASRSIRELPELADVRLRG